MTSFLFDPYEGWTMEQLKQRCRELCRVVMKYEDAARIDVEDDKVDLADVFGHGPSAPGWIEPGRGDDMASKRKLKPKTSFLDVNVFVPGEMTAVIGDRTGREPTLREFVQRYYERHFSGEMAERVAKFYCAQVEAGWVDKS